MDDDRFGTEFEHGHADYDDVELLEQARGNAQAFILGTMAHLLDQGLSVEAWATSLGQQFGPTWGEPRQWDAGEFLDAMLTNYRSLGATVVEADRQPRHAKAAIAGFPDAALCDLFQVNLEVADRVHDVPTVMGEGRGVNWSWQRDGELIRFQVDRTGGD